MIHIANHVHQNIKEEPFFVAEDCPCIIDGVDVLDALCPVSKKTGLRENPLSLIRKLITDPAKQALLGAMLQELPTDNSQSGLTDDQKFEMCFQRLSTGTPAENDVIRDNLLAIIDNFNDQQKAIIKNSQSKIMFNSDDAPAVDAAVKEG